MRSAPAPACSRGTWQVENSPSTFDSSPSPGHSNGVAVANGNCLSFDRYFYGAPAGPYGDPLWYEVGFDYWINDHYLDTPGTAASPRPQGSHCWPGSGSSADGESVGYGPTFMAEKLPGPLGQLPDLRQGRVRHRDRQRQRHRPRLLLLRQRTGPYGNTLWYLAEDITNNTYGWINDPTSAPPEPRPGPSPRHGAADRRGKTTI